jgi:tetratricopeptide (TPR) repeat protein
MFRLFVCLVLIAGTVGCAARSRHDSVRSAPAAHTQGPPDDSLTVFMDKVRAKAERARPADNQVATIELSDRSLAEALLAVKIQPSASSHRTVAGRYVRLGVLDVAHEHFSAAVALDPTDAASWDGLARIWRDWGFPHLALADAYRAVYYAPDSPTVHNTLGTVLQALNKRHAARAQFEQALALDVTAAYALSNLCYSWRLLGNASKAADACRQALQLQPGLESARNNLALAYEAAGDLPSALATLDASADAARAAYNKGLVHLARREYREALQSFDIARAERPRFREAEAIARQVRAHLHEGNQP